VSASLAADLASILRAQRGSAAAALAARLVAETHAPSVAELLELGSRAEQRGATNTELLLAVGTLLAFHAPPADALRR